MSAFAAVLAATPSAAAVTAILASHPDPNVFDHLVANDTVPADAIADAVLSSTLPADDRDQRLRQLVSRNDLTGRAALAVYQAALAQDYPVSTVALPGVAEALAAATPEELTSLWDAWAGEPTRTMDRDTVAVFIDVRQPRHVIDGLLGAIERALVDTTAVGRHVHAMRAVARTYPEVAAARLRPSLPPAVTLTYASVTTVDAAALDLVRDAVTSPALSGPARKAFTQPAVRFMAEPDLVGQLTDALGALVGGRLYPLTVLPGPPDPAEPRHFSHVTFDQLSAWLESADPSDALPHLHAAGRVGLHVFTAASHDVKRRLWTACAVPVDGMKGLVPHDLIRTLPLAAACNVVSMDELVAAHADQLATLDAATLTMLCRIAPAAPDATLDDLVNVAAQVR